MNYNEVIHVREIKSKTKLRPTEQTFLFCKVTNELVAVQCNVCYQIKSLDEFRKPTKSQKLRHYQCKECEKSRKEELRGYNTGKIYIYSISFGSESIYIGQTKGLIGRIATHISDLKRGNHCDKILMMYLQEPGKVIECFENYKVIKTFNINTSKDIVDGYEYELQIDLHKKGYKVLRRQAVDVHFLNYLVKTKRIINIFDCII